MGITINHTRAHEAYQSRWDTLEAESQLTEQTILQAFADLSRDGVRLNDFAMADLTRIAAEHHCPLLVELIAGTPIAHEQIPALQLEIARLPPLQGDLADVPGQIGALASSAIDAHDGLSAS